MLYTMSLALLFQLSSGDDAGCDCCGPESLWASHCKPSVSWDEAEDWHDLPTPRPTVKKLEGEFGPYNIGHHQANPRCSPTVRGWPDTACQDFIKKRIEFCVEFLLEHVALDCGEWAFFYDGDCPVSYCGSPSGRRLQASTPRPQASSPAPAPRKPNDFVCNAVMTITASIQKRHDGKKNISSDDIRSGLRLLYKTCDDLRKGDAEEENMVDWITGTQCLLYSELSFRVDHSLIHHVLSASVDGTQEERQMACAKVVTEVNQRISAGTIPGVELMEGSVVKATVQSFTPDGEFDLDVAETWTEYSGPARRLMTALATGSIFVIGSLCNSFQGMIPMIEA